MKVCPLAETQDLEAIINDPTVRIIACQNLEDYLKGHIPGTFYLNPKSLDDFKGKKIALSISFEKARALFGLFGIDNDVRVIAYENEGVLNTSPFFFVLDYFGHKRVQILNGGFNKWVKEGRTVTNKIERVFVRQFNPKPNPNINTRDVRNSFEDENAENY